MRRRHLVAGLVVAALGAAGGSCGGGSGKGGSASIKVKSLDPRCEVIARQAFPPGIALLPGDPPLLLALNFSPSAVVGFDITGPAPSLAAAPPILALPADSDGDGMPEGSGTVAAFPLLGGVSVEDPELADAGLGLLTASSYEEVLFFRPRQGALAAAQVDVPASFAAGDYPRLPAPGHGALRTAVSTEACIRPAAPIDSAGHDYAAGVPSQYFCDPAVRGSFLATFTSGAAVAAGHLFVSMSDLGSGQGGPDTQYLPGAVLVYDVDFASQPPRVAPNALVPFVETGAFNPTQVTRFEVGGRELVLVSVAGAVGIQPDDPSTPAVETGAIPLSPAAIEVIDARSLALVARYPLGMAALASDRIAIDPTGRLAVVGGTAGRALFAVDLSPLADLPDAPSEPVDLSAFVLFDADAPLVVPRAASSPDSVTCQGRTEGFGFDASGTRLYALESCDGTLTRFAVSLPAPGEALARGDVALLSSEALLARQDPDRRSELRDPGPLRVRPGRPGVDFSGPEFFFLAAQPDGHVCGIHVEAP